LEGDLHVGSSPTFGIYKMPSCVVVAQGTLDPLAQVRILARQPIHLGNIIDYQARLSCLKEEPCS
jgi:hypothetical protein